MAIAIAKTYAISTIAAMRATCAGTHYIVDTHEYATAVTVTGNHTSCTCHGVGCNHIHAVARRRTQDAAKDARSAAYKASFDLSYGDVVA